VKGYVAMKKHNETLDLPEKLRYSKYYEHDGMLRAYANRSMFLAIMFGIIAMGSLAFAVYIRSQPPTVIRVDRDGEATFIRPSTESGGLKRTSSQVGASNDAKPTEVEAKAMVRRFLKLYLNYDAANVDRNFAEALNLMTANLRRYTLNKLRDDDVVGTIKEKRMISNFRIRSIEPVKDNPYILTAFGVKELHQVKDGRETTDRIVSRHNIRLVTDRRSEENPSGLLVAEYWEQQMVGERNNELLQESTLGR
jgi:VirB8 protein